MKRTALERFDRELSKKAARRPLRPLHQFERDLDRYLDKQAKLRARQNENVKESVIERKVVAYAVSRGWLVRKLSWVGRNGAPDRVFMRNGLILFVEFKQRGKKPTPIQRREHERLRAAGMEVHVIDSMETGFALIDRYA